MTPFRRSSKPSIVYWHGDTLYLNITNRCSNRCYFCFRNFTDGVWGFNLKLTREPSPNELIKDLETYINRRFWREVVFCGFGEPTARLDCLLEVAEWIDRNHMKSIRVDTNGHGYLLNEGREVVKELKDAGVRKVSVSLNAGDAETYDRVCKPVFRNAFNAVLEFIERAKRELEVEATAVSIPEVDLEKVRALTEKLGVKLRIRNYELPFL